MNRKLRMGMVGGGRGAFIGTVHRMAFIESAVASAKSDKKRAKMLS